VEVKKMGHEKTVLPLTDVQKTTSQPPRKMNGADHMSSVTHVIGRPESLDRKNGHCRLKHVGRKNCQD
jgi:hypothetical protein